MKFLCSKSILIFAELTIHKHKITYELEKHPYICRADRGDDAVRRFSEETPYIRRADVYVAHGRRAVVETSLHT